MMTIQELINVLSDIDKKALIILYQLRCLNPEQLYLMSCEQELTLSIFIKRHLHRLISLDLIEMTEYQHKQYGICLKTGGINVVRQVLNLPNNVVLKDKTVIQRGYYRASDLKILPRFMSHQIQLNDFYLQFQSFFNLSYPKLKYRYLDEKHLSYYCDIRPDGLLQVANYDIFLEMDMNTESVLQLEKKWKHYRNFLQSQDYQYNERQIIIFFICENCENSTVLERRILQVQRSCYNTIGDYLGSQFECFIGDSHTLLSHLFLNLLPKWTHTISPYSHLHQLLRERLQAKTYKIQFSKPNLICGNFQFLFQLDTLSRVTPKPLFLLVDGRQSPLSMWSSLSFHSKNNILFKEQYRQFIHLIVLVNRLEDACFLADEFSIYHQPFICFTTYERLLQMKWYQALFTVNVQHQIYHFKTEDLIEKIYETQLYENR